MSLNVAATLEGLTDQYQAIAHNLANASTVGFKRRLTVMTDAGAASPSPGGTSAASMFVDFSQGRLVQTGRPLDVALSGPGFLVLESPDGPLYTRNGVLRPNAQGQLVDAEGRTVSGEGGPIILPSGTGESQVHISSGGQVAVNGAAIGALQVVEFEDTTKLDAVGLNAYKAPANVAGDKATKTVIEQGYQEASNVSPVYELVGLIKLCRLYEANIKTMQASGDRAKSILQVAMA
jgi:flagellar basal-body rod protein FlgF